MEAQRIATIVTAVVFALLVLAFVYQRTQPDMGIAAPAGEVEVEWDTRGNPTLGDPDSPINIVAFEDFLCPACSQFEEMSAPQIKRDLVDTGIASFTFMNFPVLGQDSFELAVAGECVYQAAPDSFWDFKDALFRAQGTLNLSTHQEIADFASGYAPGVDREELQTCLADQHMRNLVTEDAQLAMDLGARGTPTVFVNDQRLDRWDYDAVRSAVEALPSQTPAELALLK